MRHLYKRNKAVSLTALLALSLIACLSIIYIFNLKISERFAQQARVAAEKALNESIAERSRAEQLQMLYLREKQFAENVVSKTYQLNFEILQKTTHPTLFDDPVKALEQAEVMLMQKLQEVPNHSGYLQQKGLLAFIRQDFETAFKELSLFSYGIEDLINISAIFSQRYSDSKFLPEDGMLELLEMLMQRKDRMPIVMMVLAYDSHFRNAWSHAQFIKVLLEYANPRWEPFFAFDKRYHRLTLRGNGLDSLVLLINLF